LATVVPGQGLSQAQLGQGQEERRIPIANVLTARPFGEIGLGELGDPGALDCCLGSRGDVGDGPWLLLLLLFAFHHLLELSLQIEAQKVPKGARFDDPQEGFLGLLSWIVVVLRLPNASLHQVVHVLQIVRAVIIVVIKMGHLTTTVGRCLSLIKFLERGALVVAVLQDHGAP